MKIKDLDGKHIRVTDLELALLQADDYRHYRLTDPEAAPLSNRLQAYWEDVYQKLLALKAEQDNN